MATCALKVRDKVLARTHSILNENYPVLESWLGEFGDDIKWHKPDCGAICFAKLKRAPDTVELAHKVRTDYDILVQPGEHFGLPGFIRFGFGEKPEVFRQALDALKPAFHKHLTQ